MAIIGCSSKPCPKQIYPTLHAIKKVPVIEVIVVKGSLNKHHTKVAFNGIRALRVSERYYYNLLVDYKKTFEVEDENSINSRS